MKKMIMPHLFLGTVLWILCAVTAPAASDDVKVFLLNPSSEALARPAEIPLADLGLEPGQPYTAWAAQGKTEAIDIVGDKAYVYADLPLMGTAAIDIRKGTSAGEKMKVTKRADNELEVQTELGTCRFDATGLVAVTHNGAKIPVKTTLLTGTLQVLYNGHNLTVIQVSSERCWAKYIVCRSGLITVESLNPFIVMVGEPGWQVKTSRGAKINILSTPDVFPLLFPLDFWVTMGPSAGLVVMPDRGNQCMDYTPPPYPPLPKGIELKGPVQKICLWSVTDIEKAKYARVKSYVPLLVVSKGGEYLGRIPVGDKTVQVKIEDRDHNGPDLVADRMLFSPEGKPPHLVYSFRPAEGKGNRAQYLLIFKTADRNLDREELDERMLFAVDKFRSDLSCAEVGQVAAESARPRIPLHGAVEDWNGDGRLMLGSLLWGAYLTNDRIFHNGDWIDSLDLDGNDRGDIFSFGEAGWNGSRGTYFNFLGELESYWQFEVDLPGGDAGIYPDRNGSRHRAATQRIASQLYMDFDPGRYYKGARGSFDEWGHFLPDAESTGGLFKEPIRIFYYVGKGYVWGLCLGMLTDNDRESFQIQLSPVMDGMEQPPTFRICTYKDPWGHTLKVISATLPDAWDGKPLKWQRFPDGGVDLFPTQPWRRTAEGKLYKLKGLRATFSPHGQKYVCDEGMYRGNCSTPERIEYDEKGASFILYYSPLMGALHLKGADFGSYVLPPGLNPPVFSTSEFYHWEALERVSKFIGVEPAIRYDQPEGKRLVGPVFLSYRDLDGDGYFDTYLYDQENDGVYDRCLWYRPQGGTVTLSDGRHTAAWETSYKMEEVPYYIENCYRIKELYLKGFPEQPVVVRTSLGSSGIPVEHELVSTPAERSVHREKSPPFWVSFGPGWQVKAMADEYHAAPGKFGWTDFSQTGCTRLGSMLSGSGLALDSLTQPITQQNLQGAGMLVIGDITNRMLNEAELAELLAWVEDGGVLLLACSSEEEAERIALNNLGEQLGFKLKAPLLSRRSSIFRYPFLAGIAVSEHRVPAPWNKIELYGDPLGLGMLDGLKHLSYVGYELELDKGFRPVLTHDKKTIMGLKKLGKGSILVSGANFWSNKYMFDVHYYEAACCQNEKLIERLARWLTQDLPVLKVDKVEFTGTRGKAAFSGRGGTVCFPRRKEGAANIEGNAPDRLAYFVDGKKTLHVSRNLFDMVEVPPGRHEVEFRIEEVKK